MTTLTFHRTRADGEPAEQPRRLDYADTLRVIALEYPGRIAQLRHFIALACASPGHPVDVTHWHDGRLVYSGRLTCLPDESPRPVIVLPTRAPPRE